MRERLKELGKRLAQLATAPDWFAHSKTGAIEIEALQTEVADSRRALIAELQTIETARAEQTEQLNAKIQEATARMWRLRAATMAANGEIYALMQTKENVAHLARCRKAELESELVETAPVEAARGIIEKWTEEIALLGRRLAPVEIRKRYMTNRFGATMPIDRAWSTEKSVRARLQGLHEASRALTMFTLTAISPADVRAKAEAIHSALPPIVEEKIDIAA